MAGRKWKLCHEATNDALCKLSPIGARYSVAPSHDAPRDRQCGSSILCADASGKEGHEHQGLGENAGFQSRSHEGASAQESLPHRETHESQSMVSDLTAVSAC